MQDQLKQLNHNNECHGTKNIRRDDGRRTSIRVWWVPEFEDMSVEITAEEKTDEIPF